MLEILFQCFFQVPILTEMHSDKTVVKRSDLIRPGVEGTMILIF